MSLRHLTIPSGRLVNLRDIGGYPIGHPTHSPHMTAYRQVLRSELPTKLTPDDLQYLLALNITDCIDLRKEDERTVLVNAFQNTSVHIHILDMLPQASVLTATGAADMSYAPQTMGEVYVDMLDSRGSLYVQALETIAAAPGATLVHCYAGKDRTGVTIALLLALLGVSRPDIIADYQVSHTYLEPQIQQNMRDFPEIPAHVFSSDPAHMAAALDHLDDRYGGAQAYLTTHGLQPDTVERLHEKLIVPS